MEEYKDWTAKDWSYCLDAESFEKELFECKEFGDYWTDQKILFDMSKEYISAMISYLSVKHFKVPNVWVLSNNIFTYLIDKDYLGDADWFYNDAVVYGMPMTYNHLKLKLKNIHKHQTNLPQLEKCLQVFQEAGIVPDKDMQLKIQEAFKRNKHKDKDEIFQRVSKNWK